jgi:inositol-hexakisphosphate/diphosphoinositol-pentakisphosphate 1-kinase
MKPVLWDDQRNENGDISSRAIEIEMILKWGGDLTPLGREQAEKQGTHFRHCMYPDSEGGGVLRLHSTYRHDLKIKASDEGRVMKTAAAFTKGLLELEGPLTPILVSLVTIEEKSNQMLDKGGNCEIKEDMDKCKAHLEEVLQRDVETVEDNMFPDCVSSVRAAISRVGNPKQTLIRMHELIDGICKELDSFCVEYSSSSEITTISNNDDSPSSTLQDQLKHIHLSETPSLMLDRWGKINKDFKNKKTGSYDLTKVPDVYDMARYDVLHNSHLNINGLEDLLVLSRDLADVVVPQEYGITKEEKVNIGSKMCGKY